MIFGANSLADAQNSPPTFEKPARFNPSADVLDQLKSRAEALKKAIDRLPPKTPSALIADVAVFHKAVVIALKLGDFYAPTDLDAAHRLLEIGQARAASLAKGETPWRSSQGSIPLGFVSRIDDSVQPYAVVVPDDFSFNRVNRLPLLTILHGRDERLSEIRFLTARIVSKDASPGKITLHVYGRGNNAYRWAGETDIFEAIEAVKRIYPVDDRRIALQGFSMGGAGAWHLGLHHPSLWATVEAGAGFTETRNYAKLKDDQLSPTTAKLLNIYDAQSCALNATGTPFASYGGENDPQLQASTNILEALKTEGFRFKADGLVTRGDGFDFLKVIGAKMGHKVDAPSRAVLSAFQAEHLAQGINADPKRVRFVTYTAKYNRAAWLTVERLVEHYKRTEVDAEIIGSKLIVRKAENVAMLGVDRHVAETIEIEGEAFPLEGAVKGLLPNVYYRRGGVEGADWREIDYEQSRAFEEGAQPSKRKNLQGPIDDAFMSPFLCVRGTGQPWSAAVGRWSEARLNAFEKLWRESMRGDLPIKNDQEVTPEDVETKHLILFGDPGSNPWIDRLKDRLPTLAWTRSELKLGGERYTPADHAPSLIAPNPLNPRKYVVINSGHTFPAADFGKTNALLFPRLGDHGVFQTDGRNETLKATGLFDEGWSLRAPR